MTPLDPILVHPGGCDAAGPPFSRTYMGHASPRFGGDPIIEVGPSLQLGLAFDSYLLPYQCPNFYTPIDIFCPPVW